jgi:hypothetical protein
MNISTILLIIVIIVLLYIVVRYISTDVNTLSGLSSGTAMTTIAASSLAKSASGNNSSNFAYSVWFYVNDWNYRYGEPKVIFGRMGDSNGSDKQPCPSVTLGPISNNLDIALTIYPGVDSVSNTSGEENSTTNHCAVPNVPIQKWVNLVISVYGRSMDLYIDGKLVRTCLLPGTANINNNADIHVTPRGGFDGWTSKLEFHPNSLNPQEVWNIYTKGYSSGLSMFGTYEVQVSVLENGNEKSSVTF